MRIDGALTGNKFSVGNVLVVKPEKPSDAFYLCWFENRIEGRNDLVCFPVYALSFLWLTLQIKVVWLEEKHGWYYEGTEDSIFMSSIITKTKLNEYKDEQNNR